MDNKVAYFEKALINQPLFGGQSRINWIPFGGDMDGVVATSDPKVIEFLRKKSDTRRGGVREISQEDFEAKKDIPLGEKRPVMTAEVNPQARLARNPMPFSQQPPQEKSESAAAGAEPEPEPVVETKVGGSVKAEKPQAQKVKKPVPPEPK